MPTKSKKLGRSSKVTDEPEGVKTLSTSEFAAAIEVTPQHVARLERRGIIEKAAHGRYRASEIAKVIAFREGSPRSEAPATPELTLERTLLVKAQREKAELELAVRRGEFIDSAEEQARVIGIVVDTRNRLLAVPERAASRLGLNRQQVAAVDEEIRAALTELSQMGAAS
jgi:phage terminase Nu1 subunit (DNA packaging protein)